MHPDLERLIHLHRLDSEIAAAKAALGSMPERRDALDATLAAHEQALQAARSRAEENQARRRELDKALAAVQARLSRYKDQLMSVKTNREYTAMQSEIATAEAEVKAHEDTLLEVLLAGDDLAADTKSRESALAGEREQVAAAHTELDAEARRLRARIETLTHDRVGLRAETASEAVALYDQIAEHRNSAMAPTRDGHCTACHVRLRPQRFNEIRRGDQIFQCDSCRRLLYFEPAPGPEAVPPAATPGPVAG